MDDRPFRFGPFLPVCENLQIATITRVEQDRTSLILSPRDLLLETKCTDRYGMEATTANRRVVACHNYLTILRLLRSICVGACLLWTVPAYATLTRSM